MILLYIVNDIDSGVVYSWVKFRYYPLCTQFQSTFKVKPGNTMLDIILLRNPEYCHTDAVQGSPTEEGCEY